MKHFSRTYYHLLAIISLTLLALVASLWQTPTAAAHIRGKPSFLYINKAFVDYYTVKPVPGLLHSYPQSMDDNSHAVGEPVAFTIDKRLLAVSFDNASRMKLSWDFGDGTKGNGFTNTHTYTKAGTFVLTVYDVSADDKPVLVEETAIQIFPDSSFIYPSYNMGVNGKKVFNNTDKQSVRPGKQVTLSVILLQDKPIDSYEWDFGDGTKGEGQTVTHTYGPDFAVAYPTVRLRFDKVFYADNQLWLQNPDASAAAIKSAAADNSNSGVLGNVRHSLQSRLNTIFSDGKVNYLLALFVLLFAIVAGALHSLTPGHGKTILTALLVGREGSRYKDLAILTASITIAHTLVIYIIGFVFLAVSKTHSANSTLPFFERASATLVIILALYLMGTGLKRIRHGHIHVHSGGHSHDHLQPATTGQRRDTWSLVLAGAGGGIVPCIDALSLMLLAAGLGHVGFGLLLVVFFSLGLAGTIALLGLIVIAGKKHLTINKQFEQKIGLYAPLASGTIILLLAIFTLWP